MSKPLGSEKTGGRKKGTPNKKTIGLENALANHNIDLVEQIAQVLPQLALDKRADVLLNMMSYLFPKRKAIELTADPIAVLNSKIEEKHEPTEAEIEEMHKKTLSIARRLLLLNETPEERYIRSQIEYELSLKKLNK